MACYTGPCALSPERLQHCCHQLQHMPQQLVSSAWHHLHVRTCRVVTRLEEGGVFAAAAFSGLPLDFEVRCRHLALDRA